jgi:erythrocyte band 7 integral membrane protein
MSAEGQTTLVMEAQPQQQQQAVVQSDDSSAGLTYYLLAGISLIFIVLFFPLSLLFTIKIVTEYERAVILRLGRLSSKKAKGPGLFFVIPCTDNVNKIDLRTITLDIPPQEILTKDSVTVRVDAVVFYRIYNPTMAIINVENANAATFYVAQTTLRNVLGTKKLAELLTDRDAIGDEMQVIETIVSIYPSCMLFYSKS